ncbi:MAG: hypothetical protein C5B47_00470 [Verrucomicrobia bacterium]|nr:MAG: hypothetical protein C5B47_00470 [Verrucomicrobiota bacterium]
MTWQDIDAEKGQIFIRPEVAKQTDGMLECIVDFTEPLKKRADFFQQRTGKLHQEKKLPWSDLKKLPWSDFPENALRHSFAT